MAAVYEPNYWRISGELEFDVLNRHIYIYGGEFDNLLNHENEGI